jgi:hypothetical protein
LYLIPKTAPFRGLGVKRQRYKSFYIEIKDGLQRKPSGGEKAEI